MVVGFLEDLLLLIGFFDALPAAAEGVGAGVRVGRGVGVGPGVVVGLSPLALVLPSTVVTIIVAATMTTIWINSDDNNFIIFCACRCGGDTIYYMLCADMANEWRERERAHDDDLIR